MDLEAILWTDQKNPLKWLTQVVSDDGDGFSVDNVMIFFPHIPSTGVCSEWNL